MSTNFFPYDKAPECKSNIEAPPSDPPRANPTNLGDFNNNFCNHLNVMKEVSYLK